MVSLKEQGLTVGKEAVFTQSSLEDWSWIEKIRGGDRSAFNQLFDKYKPHVINLAFRFVRERGTAEDIAQEIFIKIYENKTPFHPTAKFSTWLYRVTVNAAVDFLRKKKFLGHSLNERIEGQEEKTFLENLADFKSSGPNKILEEKELSELIRGEIDRLPEKFKTPFLLYQFQEMPYREIAKILGMTEKAVERRLYRAKEVLREKLKRLKK